VAAGQIGRQILGMTSVPAERLERLVAAGTLLTSELSLDGVLSRVTALAAEIIGARYAAIGVLAPDGRVLERFHTHGISEEDRGRIGEPPRGHGILGLVIREPRAIRLPDLARHPDSAGFPPHHPPMHSFLGVPIRARGVVFGNLYLTEKLEATEFTEDDERIALLLASQAGAAVDNARLHEESARLLGEVQQLQRSRERFFATVNHELRNALAAVHGWAEVQVRSKASGPPSRAALEVLDAAESAVGLINDLLDLSRLDEDRLKPAIRPVDCSSVARRALARLAPVAEAKPVTLSAQIPGDLPTSPTDAARVEQILVNLLGNALRHAPSGGTVELVAFLDGDRVVLLVTDDGPGIDPARVEHIFDVYATSPSEESRGMGLGLPLSRRLARLLGGELIAVARPGQGGCFRLELPRGDDA
jgi:signal transduction histidine kinase